MIIIKLPYTCNAHSVMFIIMFFYCGKWSSWDRLAKHHHSNMQAQHSHGQWVNCLAQGHKHKSAHAGAWSGPDTLWTMGRPPSSITGIIHTWISFKNKFLIHTVHLVGLCNLWGQILLWNQLCVFFFFLFQP